MDENNELENISKNDIELISLDDISDLGDLSGNLDGGLIDEEPISNEVLENSTKNVLGITDEQLREFFNYLICTGPKPSWADKFMADIEGRIKDSTSMIMLQQQAQIPNQLAYINALQKHLYSEANLKYMDSKTLSTQISNVSNLINNTMKNSISYIQGMNDWAALSSERRALVDQLIMIPDDKLERVKLMPKLVELPEESWNRIEEIINLEI